jgi:dolichol-phosphate mannosyltransferase
MPGSPSWKLRSFCVIIPMYNEEQGAAACVRSVCSKLAALPYPGRLIVVNDGSRDRTGALLDGLQTEFPEMLVIHHMHNGGYGAALRTGIAKAVERRFDYAIFMDSDLTNDPADIPKFLECMKRGVDVIKASRFVAGGAMQGVPWRRSIFSRGGNLIARFLFRAGISDCTNGFRAVKVEILGAMRLKESGFPIIVEELYQSKWLARSFCEVPVVLTSRAAQLRPTSFSYKPATLRKYLNFALRAFLGIKPELHRKELT